MSQHKLIIPFFSLFSPQKNPKCSNKPAGFSASQHSLAIESWRLPSANSLILTNSYNSKQGHWARSVTELVEAGLRCKSNEELILNRSRLETSNVAQYGRQYGSFETRPAFQDTMS